LGDISKDGIDIGLEEEVKWYELKMNEVIENGLYEWSRV